MLWLLLPLLACKGSTDETSDDPRDSGVADTGSSDTGSSDTGAADTGSEDSGDTSPVGDGTELVLLGYLGVATVDASGWSGTEALVAKAADSGTERCRFEWTATGTPHPEAASCDGCAFAHRVRLEGGRVVGPSCDWLFETNGPPPADGGAFPYAYHDDFEGNGPALLYFYVDRWISLPNTVSYDSTSRQLTYEVSVGEDYF